MNLENKAEEYLENLEKVQGITTIKDVIIYFKKSLTQEELEKVFREDIPLYISKLEESVKELKKPECKNREIFWITLFYTIRKNLEGVYELVKQLYSMSKN